MNITTHVTQPLIWTGGDLELTGFRGPLEVAKIIREMDTFNLYDQRWREHEGLGSLEATGIALDEAKRRAEGW